MLSKSTFTASFLDNDLLVENDVTKQGDYIEQYNVVVNVAKNGGNSQQDSLDWQTGGRGCAYFLPLSSLSPSVLRFKGT